MAASGEAAQRIANERRFMDSPLAMDYGAARLTSVRGG
jgi:hypothetical protein